MDENLTDGYSKAEALPFIEKISKQAISVGLFAAMNEKNKSLSEVLHAVRGGHGSTHSFFYEFVFQQMNNKIYNNVYDSAIKTATAELSS